MHNFIPHGCAGREEKKRKKRRWNVTCVLVNAREGRAPDLITVARDMMDSDASEDNETRTGKEKRRCSECECEHVGPWRNMMI